MAKIAFILLCHKDPDAIIKQAQSLTAVGDYMSIHFDARAKAADYARIRKALEGNLNVTFAKKRIKCGWGEWSLVQATLIATQAAVEAFPRATHFYMLSGDCMAIKSAQYAHEFLDRREVDYIESFDYFASDWIKTGIQAERLIYRHYFNERENKRLHDEWVETAIEYKIEWERELQRRERYGIEGPAPLPHPDHVVIDMKTGDVRITGPFTKEDKARYDKLAKAKADFQAELDELQQLLRDEPDYPYRDLVEADIEHDKKLLDVIRRVIPDQDQPKLSRP